MSILLLLSLIVPLAVLVYQRVIYQTLISPLSRIPNAHWSSSVNPGWILWIRKNGLENRILLECHRKLGPIVRTSPNEISIHRIEDVRTVYSGNFEKETWLARSFDNYGFVFLPL